MRAAVRILGNSSGVLLPKSLLGEIGVAVGDTLDMTLEEGRIILIPVKHRARTGWAEASQRIAEARDDESVWPDFGNDDDETLTW